MLSSAPRSPDLSETKETPEYRKNYLNNMMDWRDATREQAGISYSNSIEYSNIDKYIRYLEGNQWDTRRARYKSKYVDNKVELTRREKMALLTDSRPVVDVACNLDNEAYDSSAEMIRDVIRAEWLAQNMPDTLVDVVDIAMLHGVAFARLGGASPGSMSMLALGPDNVIPIQPSKRSLQDATAVFYRNWKPVSYFKRVFPFNSAGIENEAKYWESRSQDRFLRPNHIPEYTWSQMSPQFRQLIGVKNDSGLIPGSSKFYGSIELEEYYVDDISINESTRTVIVKDPYLAQSQHNWWYAVKPGQRLYPRKRLIIYAGNRLMYDGPNPFWHGMYPFVDLKLNPVPWSYYGMSTYRPLLPVQDAINEIPAGTMDMIKRALNPTIIAKTNVASETAWREYLSDLPGARLKVNPNVNLSTDIAYGPVPQLPNYVQLQYQAALGEYDKLSGMVDIADLTGKKQMPSGETLDQMRDSLQTPLRLEERRLESFIQRCGQQAVSNVVQFYTAPKRLYLLGQRGLIDEDFVADPGKIYPEEETDESLAIERKRAFHKLFSFKVQSGSLHSGAEDRAKQEATIAVSQGLISKKEWYRRTGITDEHADQILNELMDEAKALAGLEQQGRTPRDAGAKDGMASQLG